MAITTFCGLISRDIISASPIGNYEISVIADSRQPCWCLRNADPRSDGCYRRRKGNR